MSERLRRRTLSSNRLLVTNKMVRVLIFTTENLTYLLSLVVLRLFGTMRCGDYIREVKISGNEEIDDVIN